MKLINEAHEVLADPRRRADYDARQPRGGARHVGRETMQDRNVLRCPACEGTGQATCLTCDGRGGPDCPGCYGDRQVTCPACEGEGRLSAEAYEELLNELLRAQGQGEEVARRHRRQEQDPFWQPGYWDRPQAEPSTGTGEIQTSPPIQLRLAPILSFVIPGAGQLYNKEPQKALMYFGIFILLSLGKDFLSGLGMLLWLGFWFYNVYDAYSTSARG